ncbi:MAG: lamin tail domain-containing protein [bacterium]
MNLNNEGEYLKLIDNQGNLIDEVDCSSGWFAGDNKTKQIMKRKDSHLSGNNSDNWQTGAEKQETRPPVFLQEVGSPVFYPAGIVINEVLPSPEGPDADNEWIELFNQNDFTVDLSGWKISDTAGATKLYLFPEKTNIEPHSFLLLPRTESKITLNNDYDGLNLSQPNDNIIDGVSWEKAINNQSYNRSDPIWKWSPVLTPNSANIFPEVIKNNSPVELLNEKNETLAISVKDSDFPLSTALLVATLSGGTIVLLKRLTKDSF